jgi:hypothetical protein
MTKTLNAQIWFHSFVAKKYSPRVGARALCPAKNRLRFVLKCGGPRDFRGRMKNAVEIAGNYLGARTRRGLGRGEIKNFMKVCGD